MLIILSRTGSTRLLIREHVHKNERDYLNVFLKKQNSEMAQILNKSNSTSQNIYFMKSHIYSPTDFKPLGHRH